MTSAQIATGAATRPAALAREVPAGRRPAWWGMVLFLVTDLAVFAGALASWFYLRFTAAAAWPPAGISEPKLVRPAVMTVVLLASSAPMVWADLGIKKGDRRRLITGILGTVLLGGGFLALQATEYSEKLKEFGPSQGAYGSMFYAITSFHALHVLLGIVALLFVATAAASGRITTSHHIRVRVVSLYWHTVDAVWVAILLSLYLSPHL
jgi:cytochrome c oxidase subunit 3/cytochrome c oxidase subunit I+III